MRKTRGARQPRSARRREATRQARGEQGWARSEATRLRGARAAWRGLEPTTRWPQWKREGSAQGLARARQKSRAPKLDNAISIARQRCKRGETKAYAPWAADAGARSQREQAARASDDKTRGQVARQGGQTTRPSACVSQRNTKQAQHGHTSRSGKTALASRLRRKRGRLHTGRPEKRNVRAPAAKETAHKPPKDTTTADTCPRNARIHKNIDRHSYYAIKCRRSSAQTKKADVQ